MKALVINCGSRNTKNIIKHLRRIGFSCDQLIMYHRGVEENSLLNAYDLSSLDDSVHFIHTAGKEWTAYTDFSHITQQYSCLVLSGGGIIHGHEEAYNKAFHS